MIQSAMASAPLTASNEPRTTPLLEVRDLAVSFANGREPPTRAVDGVSLTIHYGQTLALVGESGCGKSVTALSLLHLLPRTAARVERGIASFNTPDGLRDLLSLSPAEIRSVRGRQIAMIFQEPMTSLNPVFTIGEQIIEAVRTHQRAHPREAEAIAIESLRTVGIVDPATRLRSYPHQFSGGMRQRVMIAMALACEPSLLLADEPTTALDVTVQAQILSLLRAIQRTRRMGVMFITHDLGIVAHHADVTCVMYAGRVVEYGRTTDVLARPLHPYTRALISCIPRLGTRRDRLTTIANATRDPADFAVATPSGPISAWWPSHSAPNDVVPAPRAPHDYALCAPEPDRWIGAWRNSAAIALANRPPDLPVPP